MRQPSPSFGRETYYWGYCGPKTNSVLNVSTQWHFSVTFAVGGVQLQCGWLMIASIVNNDGQSSRMAYSLKKEKNISGTGKEPPQIIFFFIQRKKKGKNHKIPLLRWHGASLHPKLEPSRHPAQRPGRRKGHQAADGGFPNVRGFARTGIMHSSIIWITLLKYFC